MNIGAHQWLHAGVRTISSENAPIANSVTELNATDRCDACGAQGYIRVTMPSGELIFCAHHGRKHASALSEVATHIHDESDRLLDNP